VKRYLATIALLTFAGVLAAVLSHDRLPERMLIHFNARGVADGFASRARRLVFLFSMIPSTSIAMLLVIPLERRFGRGDAHMGRKLPYFYGAGVAVAVLLLLVFLMALESALTGVDPSMPGTYTLLGAMLVLFGLVAGKLRGNYVIGIRTPWTLVAKPFGIVPIAWAVG